MINIYSKDETNFNNNGLATLIPISCGFSVSINGGWSLTMEHPFDAEGRYSHLIKDNILRVTGITCIREWATTTQFFRIYDVRRNLMSYTVIAFPLALEATYDAPIEELHTTGSTLIGVAEMLEEYVEEHDGNDKYTIVSDYATSQKWAKWENTNLIAAISGADENSVVNVWGCEVAYDDYKIMLKEKLGDQNGVYPIRYGRNLVGIEHDTDMSSVITRVYPISNDGLRLNGWEDTDTVEGQSYVDSPRILNYPFIRCSFIELEYKLIDTDSRSNTQTAEKTAEWSEDMIDAVDRAAHELWNLIIDDRTKTYNAQFVKTIMGGEDGITRYLQNKYFYTHKGWQSLVKSCAKQGVDWIKDEDLGEAQWLHLQGYWYGTTDINGARLHFQRNNYLYDYGNSKWYYFDDLGMMSTEEIPQEKIDELNSYTWHEGEKGWWYGYDDTHFMSDCWVEWKTNDVVKHYWVDSEGYMDDTKTDENTWSWSQEIDGHQYGTDVDHVARNQYVLIEKVYEWFGPDGFWQDWKRVELLDCQWFQTDDGKDWYGSRAKHYAHNEYVYTTEEGHMFETWLDNEGWVDENASGESEFGWHGSGTETWFGKEGATASQKNNYIHDKWAYIDGTYYWFNHDGYISPEPDQAYQNWEWGMQVDEKTGRQWFGNTDVNYGLIYIKDQWLPIEGIMYRFDQEGYKEDRDQLKKDTVAWFANTVYDASIDYFQNCLEEAYDFLYTQMTDWCDEQFSKGMDRPTVTIDVDMIDLSKTSEYSDYQGLERICLGDKVVVVDNIGDRMEERVVGLTYDCIRGYNTEVIVGDLSKTVSQMLSTTYKGADHGNLIAGDNVVINGRVISVEDYVGRVVGMTDLLLNGHSVVSGNTGSFGIQAGENINITRSGNVLTISGEGGGGLNYFHETQASLYGQNTIDDELRRNGNYRFNHAVSARYNLHEPFSTWGDVQFDTINDNGEVVIAVTWERTIITSLWSQSSGEDNGIMVITTDPTVCGLNATDRTSIYQTLTASYVYGDFTDEQSHYDSIGGWATSTFVYQGTTYYVMLCHNNAYKDWSYEADSIKTIGSTLHYKDDRGIYSSVAEFALAVFTMSNTGQTISSYSGLHQGDNLAFFAGGSDSNGTDAPIKIFSDGTTEGLVTEEDLQDYAKIEDVPEIEANPSETPTDVLNSIGIDGTIYELQGSGGGSALILNACKYSTDEQVVGIAENGKPIYRKTVFENLTDGTIATIPNGENIRVISAAAYAVIDGNDQWLYLNYFYSSSDKCNLYSRGNLLRAETTGAFTGSYTKIKAVIEYTKSTDTAGSGGYQAYGFSPIIYSEEEREVGVWTDNKPLYQKTWIETIPNASGFASFTNNPITNLDKVISTEYSVRYKGQQGETPWYTSASVYYDSMDTTGFSFYFNGTYLAGNYIVFTARYTKTTDVAGSGEYNTLGIPNVHYDGNEKVIGTWFGETLYERTFTGLATNTNGDSWVNISGIDATTWKDAVNVEIYSNSSDVNNKLTRIALGEARVFNGNVQVTTSVSYNREINVATIQYTKTT